MSNLIQSLQVRIGEFANKIIRVYGRYNLLDKLSKLPSLEEKEQEKDNNTVCLVMGTARTSSQFLLSAYLWRYYLPSSISVRMMHDGLMPKYIYDLAHRLFGDRVQLTDVCSLIDKVENATSSDEQWHQFISTHRFGRKLLAIYHLSQTYNVIYSDDDILLFQSPTDLLDAVEKPVDFLYSPDTSGVQCPTHKEMVAYGKSIGVTPLPDFQAGLLYLKQGVLKRSAMEKYLFQWMPDNDMHFSEQTLLSLVMSESSIRSGILPSEKYINNASKGRFLWEKDLDYFDGTIILRHFMGTVRHRYFEAANEIIRSMKFI